MGVKELAGDVKDTLGNMGDAAYSYATGQGTKDAAQMQIDAAKAMAEDQRRAGGQGADLIGLAENQGQGQLYDAFNGAMAAILGGAPLPGMTAPGDYQRWENQLHDLYQSQPLDDQYGSGTYDQKVEELRGQRGQDAQGTVQQAAGGMQGVAPTIAPKGGVAPNTSMSGALSSAQLAALFGGRK